MMTNDGISDNASTHSAVQIPRSRRLDRKSTRLNSSHQIISYAVFCLKKNKQPDGLLKQQRSPTCAATAPGVRARGPSSTQGRVRGPCGDSKTEDYPSDSRHVCRGRGL